jgi:hypothetical protein
MATTKLVSRPSSSQRQTAAAPSEAFDVGNDLIEYLKEYGREKPEVLALWCFGIGFILGWKLKPW